MPTILDGVSTNETEGLRAVMAYADPTAPKLATEFNAMSSVALECLLVDRFNPDASVDKAQLRRMCSAKVRERSGQETRTIADLIGVYDPQDLSAPVSKAYVTLAKGATFFLTDVRGIHLDGPALVAGDLSTIYKVQVGYRIEIQGADNDEYQFKAGVSVLDWWENVAFVA